MNKNILITVGAILLLAGGAMVGLSLSSADEGGELTLQIEHKPAIMSTSYKVHANQELDNGRYWAAKVLLTNDGPGSITDLKVSYRIPNFVEWDNPRPYPRVLPGQKVVDLYYPRFPAKLSDKRTDSTEQIEIRITYNSAGEEREELRKVSFDLLGRNSLVYTTMDSDEIINITDAYENTELVASFVTPDDPVIKYFTQQIQQKVMGGMSFDASSNPEEAARFIKAVFDYQVAAGMVYANTLGLPVQQGNSFTTVQQVRMPREVLVGEAGLCIELSTLFASVAMSAGLRPVIFLTAGHAWPGIKMDNGSIIAYEATAIGGPALGGVGSFEQAMNAGYENQQIWFQGGGQKVGGPSITILDIAELHSAGIRPPELADDPHLTQRLQDKIALLTSGASQPEPKKTTRKASSGGGGSSGGGSAPAPRPSVPAGFAAYQHPSGAYRMAHPSNWAAMTAPLPQMPSLASVIALNPNGFGPAAEVYMFPGVGTSDGALDNIAYAIENFGGYLEAGPTGNTRIKGANYQTYEGQTVLPAGVIQWRGFFRQVSGGTVGVIISAPAGSMGTYNTVLSQIADTFVVQ